MVNQQMEKISNNQSYYHDNDNNMSDSFWGLQSQTVPMSVVLFS